MATKTDRLGETRTMNCGMEATIIRYGNATDIDVRFEDGAVTKHKAYKEFGNGKIANPNVKDRLGEARMMNCGMKATIARYNGVRDIDVRFEDGIVMEHKSYSKFKRGNIAHPSTTAGNRLGETRMMNCGMEATIIRYGNNTDIDVCFEDGAIVEHKAYDAFKKGGIAHPSTTAKARLGEIRMMSCDMEATIIRYGGATDVDVRFEDGKVVEHKTYRAFN